MNFYRGPLTPRVGESPRFLEKSQSYGRQALSARSLMRPDVTTEQRSPATIGGAVGAAAGMGLAGYTATGTAAGGWWGAAAGLVAYLLS